MAATNKKTTVIKRLLLIALITFVFISSPFLVKADHEKGELLIDLKIPSEYRKVIAGQTMLTETEVTLIREVRENKINDITILFTIINSSGANVLKLSETKGTILSSHSIREFSIPSELNPGLYLLSVRVSYNGFFREDQEAFEIVSSEEANNSTAAATNNRTFIKSLLVIVVIIFTAILHYQYQKVKKIEKLIRKVSEKHLKRQVIKIRRYGSN